MPPAVAAFAAWAGMSLTAAYVTVASVIISAGTAVYGAAQARKAERAARGLAGSEALKDRMATRIATEAPHRYVYGRAKVGADIVAAFTSGDRDQYKHLVCVHAAHECDAIEEVWVANALVANLDASGDPTAGRFAVVPDSEISEEQKTGPTFNLAFMPRVGSVWAFTGAGATMQPVAVTAVNGRTVTVNSTGPVTVTYERPVRTRMGDTIDHSTVPAATNPVVRVQRHLGGASDVADVMLRNIVGDQWPATAVLRGLCYTVITLDLTHPEFQGGIPPIHAVIRGKKLYDPRDGQTRWSQNPALVIMDYLTSPLCGVPMAELPAAQFITAANVCDEVSPTGGARYTINGTVTSDQGQAGVLESMTQAMAGGMVATTWDVYAGKYIAPVAALTQEDIVGSLSMNPGVSDASVYNGVKGQYVAPENKYVLTDFKPYQNAAYREHDGRDLYTNIDFPFTDSLQRVTNLARIFTEDQRNGFTIKAEFSLKAWPLKVGQRITFTSAFFGQSAKVYRITDKSYAPNSAVQLSLKEDDASIWDYADATVVDSTPNSDLPDPWKIDAPEFITCTSGEAALLRQADGSTVPRILVSWPAIAQANGVQIELEWRAVSSPTWERTTVSAGETQGYLSPITPGFFYIVRARTANPSLNVLSNWIAAVYQVEVFKATPTVYMYAADKPATPAGAASYQWSNGTFGAAPAGWSLIVPTAPAGGNVTLWAATVAISDISDVLSSFDWAQADVVGIGYAPTSAGQGPAGYSNARVFAYQRKAAAPTGTPGAVNYDFTTGSITTATLLNGWQKTIPAADGNPLYVTSASASSAGTVDTIATGEWSGAVVLAYDGGAGTPGVNSASVTLYQRNTTGTAPALPNAAATYTFSPPGITGLTNGWSVSMPAASTGKYLFATTATAASTSATDAIAAAEWAPAQILAQDGSNGADGIKTAVVYAYQRAAGAPAGTPGAVTYDFTSNAITTASLANGWLKTIPAANGNPLYVTAATASGTGATDSITGTEWSGAVVLAADGGAGAPGLNNATVTLYQRTASATAPAKPSAATTYTFASGAITGLNNGWNTYIPTTGGAYLHTTFATAISAAATDTIAASEWAAVQLMYDAADLIAAKAAADAAVAAVAVIGNDGVLSKDEKPEVKRAWSAIDAEAPGFLNQAAALSVSTAAYTSAFNTLSVYLGTVAYDDYTTDTAITRTTFITNFTNYYTAKEALRNALTTAAARADFSAYKTWNFRGSLEGWVNVSGLTSMTATADSIIVDSAGSDPIFRSPGLSFAGAQSPIVRARIKRTAGTVGSWDGNLFFTSVAQPGEGAGGAMQIADPTVSGQWVIAEWNMAGNTAWMANTITSFRPDLGKDAADTFEVDWISVGRYGPAVSTSELAAVQAAVDAAIAEQAVIANDNILSKGEKSLVIRDWDAIAGEKDNLIGQATALGVSSATYAARVTDLSNYLVGLSPSWFDAGQDTPIVGLTFRTRFIDVYTAKTALIAAMNAKSATTANANSIAGMHHFRVLTQGGLRTAAMPAGTHGFYKNGAHVYAAARSYALVVIRRSDGVIVRNNTYDVWGDKWQANALKDALNAALPSEIVVVYTFDEPNQNRLEHSLTLALSRCGASSAIFGSPEFKTRSAYCLIGVPGCGEGNGAEFYQGAVHDDPNAWLDVSFVLTNGNYTAMAGYTPRSLKDYGYSGDMEATKGAPVGTKVADMDAAAVAAGAASGNKLAVPFSVSINGGISEAGPGKYIALPSRTATVTGGDNLKSLQWIVGNIDESRISILSGSASATVSLASRVLITPTTNNAFLTVTAIGLDGRITTDTVDVQAQHY